MTESRRDDILRGEDLSVWRFVLNDLLTNGFVVREESDGSLAIVDPGGRGNDLVDAAEEWGGEVRWILVTHHHADHHADLPAVRESFPGAEVVAPPGGGLGPDRAVSGGEAIEWSGSTIRIVATPGHSPESVSFRIGSHVFVGDYLFRLGSGRTDGAGSSTSDVFRVAREVFAPMPDATILWCGHGPPSTLGEERDGNPFWRFAFAEVEPEPVDEVRYRGSKVPVLAWADDYDGGRKALLKLADGSFVIVPGSQVLS